MPNPRRGSRPIGLMLVTLLASCGEDSNLAGPGEPAIGTPAGWSWQNPLPQGNWLHGVDFVDVNTGTAVGDGGTILRTTDGGDTWTEAQGPIGGYVGLDFEGEDHEGILHRQSWLRYFSSERRVRPISPGSWSLPGSGTVSRRRRARPGRNRASPSRCVSG